MFTEAVGWVGSIVVISAYGLNAYQRIRSDSWIFYMLNIIGGTLLVIYSLSKDAYANVFINVVWIVIALPGLVRLIGRRKP